MLRAACLLCTCFISSAQPGKVFDNLSLNSKMLNMERKFAVYHSPDYDNSQSAYPVIYLFHGVGDDDFLNEGNSLLHITMRKQNISHEFRIRDVVHSWQYWRAALPSVLEFVSMGFHQF